MSWNWQLPEWPKFTYEPASLSHLERKFLLSIGSSFAFLKNISQEDREQFTVEILSIEGQQSSKIEGELLERESLQSSIRKQFGLQDIPGKKSEKEFGMAEVLCSVYKTFNLPLSHEMICGWQGMLFRGWSRLQDIGKYRVHPDPMQIVSGRLDDRRVYFEAPPSERVPDEMALFVNWYNTTKTSESILGRAALAHVYFESIHPFEDGNGRIGRVLVEKALSQDIGQPVLIAVSKFIEKNKKEYYSELARCNRTLKIQPWVEFFASMIIEAQEDSMRLLRFLLNKSRIFTALSGKLNLRQEKVLLRMFAEGPDGFVGGLSAEKYIAITKAPRATTTRDLNDLVEKGALVKTGELRHTRYRLNLE
jgi:Fic family protein